MLSFVVRRSNRREALESKLHWAMAASERRRNATCAIVTFLSFWEWMALVTAATRAVLDAS
jgi:hypothetical protein